MTLAEFEDKYYLHDSSIDKVDYDADKKILTLTTALPKKFFPECKSVAESQADIVL